LELFDISKWTIARVRGTGACRHTRCGLVDATVEPADSTHPRLHITRTQAVSLDVIAESTLLDAKPVVIHATVHLRFSQAAIDPRK
jgi:hypothetical protein